MLIDPEIKLATWEYQQARKAGLSIEEWRRRQQEREEAERKARERVTAVERKGD